MPHRGRHFLSVVALAVLAQMPAAASAAEIDHAQEYRACIALVYREADKAFESARAWEAKGGGVWARHCAALATFELGLYPDAAARLEALAGELPRDGKVSPADVLAQAANVWLMAGELERAKLTIGTAHRMAPEDGAILVDQGRILAEAGDYRGALAALDQAVALIPGDGDAQAFRASALRRLGRLEEARQAAETAVRVDPDNPSALLERGLVRHALGDLAGARLDWQATVEHFDGTPAAEVARGRLQALDGRGG